MIKFTGNLNNNIKDIVDKDLGVQLAPISIELLVNLYRGYV
ncbi:hypothetical protein [Terrisporobacter othiniensis]|nr:hypothetical protein [Terrisporobacter othiniensis]